MLPKGSPTEIVMCKYLAFKGTSNSNFNMYVPCFQRDQQLKLQCASATLSKGPICIIAVVLQRLLISKVTFMLLIR